MSLTYTIDPTTGEYLYDIDILYSANYEQENLSELYTIKEAVIDQYINELNSLGTPESETVITALEDLKQQMSAGLIAAKTAASYVQELSADIYSSLKDTVPSEAIKYKNIALEAIEVNQVLGAIDLSMQISEEGWLQGGISGGLSIIAGAAASIYTPAPPRVKIAVAAFAGVGTDLVIDFIFDEGIEPVVQAIKDMIAERVIQESQNNPTQPPYVLSDKEAEELAEEIKEALKNELKKLENNFGNIINQLPEGDFENLKNSVSNTMNDLKNSINTNGFQDSLKNPVLSLKKPLRKFSFNTAA